MNMKTDYSTYDMAVLDYLSGYLIGFLMVFFMSYAFFESIIFSMISAALSGLLSIKPYKSYLVKRRKKKLLIQFKDFLESLSSSYAAGRNTHNAFCDTYSDIQMLHGQSSYMAVEIDAIIKGFKNGHNIEDLINDFALRSDIDDIKSFAGIFDVCSVAGGNINAVVSETREMICDKIEIEI